MGETVLEVKDLSRSIANGTAIFSNISFEVNQGTTLCLPTISVVLIYYCR